ncbi:MAG: hypothetical protein P8179_15905 [Candidatus Thiodiazotropha sp.]
MGRKEKSNGGGKVVNIRPITLFSNQIMPFNLITPNTKAEHF